MASSRHAKDCVDYGGEGARIVITHYTNPHMFWFCDLDSQYKNLQLRIEIEDAVAHYVQERHTRNTKITDFNKGDIVAFKYLAFQKYIRARIDYKFENRSGKKFVVWALDYGFPVLTNPTNMFRLPPELTKRSGIIKCGGLAAIAAKEECDAFTSKWQVVPQVKWSGTACNDLRKLLVKSKSVRFSPSFHTKPKSEKHYWGDLQLNMQGNKIIDASDFLVYRKCALKDRYVSKYRDVFASTKFVEVDPWTDNGKWNGKKNIVEASSSGVKKIHQSQKKDQRWVSESEESDDVNDWKKLARTFKPHSKDFNMPPVESSRHVNISAGNELDKADIAYGEMRKKSFYGNQEMPETLDRYMNKVKSLKKEMNEYWNNFNDSKKHYVYDLGIEKKNKNFPEGKFVEKDRNKLAFEEYNYIPYFEANSKVKQQKTKTEEMNTDKKHVEKMERPRFPAGYDFNRERTLGLRQYSMLRKSDDDNVLIDSFDSLKNFVSITHSKKKGSVSQEDKHPMTTSHRFQQNEFSNAFGKKEHLVDNYAYGKGLNAASRHQNQLMMKNSSQHKNMEKAREKEKHENLNNVNAFKKYEEKSGQKLISYVDDKGKKCLEQINWIPNFAEKSQENHEAMEPIEAINTNKKSVEKDSHNVVAGNEMEHFRREKPTFHHTKRQVPKIPQSSNESNETPINLKSDYDGNVFLNSRFIDPEIFEELKPMPKDLIMENQNAVDDFGFVLAHSSMEMKPGYAKTREDCGLSNLVDEIMKRKNHQMNRLQAYSWPHIMNGESTFIINAKSSGKTFSYIPAICSILHKYKVTVFRDHGVQLNDGPGPIIVILVKDCKQVERVYVDLDRFLYRIEPKVEIVTLRGQRNLKETQIKLVTGCDILITTPTSFLRLLKANETIPLLEKNRIRTWVIDDVDVFLNRSGEEFKKLFHEIFKLMKQRKDDVQPQLIVTSSEWNPNFQQIISFSERSLLLIGDFLEAAFYGKANIKIAACSKSQKVNEIMDFIKLHSTDMKPVLVFCEDDEVLELCNSFKAVGVDTISYNEDSTGQDRQNAMKQDFHTPILVCGGNCYFDLGFRSIPTLIHYSLPITWTKFTQRFVVSADLYANLTQKQAEGATQKKPKLNSLVFFDEDNDTELPKFIDFIKRHRKDHSVPSQLLKIAEQIERSREADRGKNILMLCPLLMEFGNCTTKHTCKYRHILTEDDIDLVKYDIPESGELKIKILKVISPTHFIIRLMAHKTEGFNWKTIRCPTEAEMFNLDLSLHYSNKKKLKRYWPLKFNDICIFKKDDFVYRAIVLQIPPIENAEVIQSLQVDIKLIDTGDIEKSVLTDNLYECESEFKQFPNQAIEMRLLDVFPMDKEYTWDEETTNEAKELLTLDSDEFIWVKITRALSQCIWVNNIFIAKPLPSLGTCTNTLILPTMLVKNGHACLDKKLSEKLIHHLDHQVSLLSKTTIDEDDRSPPEENSGLTNDGVPDPNIQGEEEDTKTTKNPEVIGTDLIDLGFDDDDI